MLKDNKSKNRTGANDSVFMKDTDHVPVTSTIVYNTADNFRCTAADFAKKSKSSDPFLCIIARTSSTHGATQRKIGTMGCAEHVHDRRSRILVFEARMVSTAIESQRV